MQTQRATRWIASEGAPAGIDEVLRCIEPWQRQIQEHAMYGRLDSLASVRMFMESHVFAVLDFMWLLTALQRRLTCVDVPWLPVGNPNTRRFINELVLEEESDIAEDGWTSHFELYRRAMDEVGADGAPIDDFVQALTRGKDPVAAIRSCGAPIAVQAFVERTWSLITTGEDHQLAGAFAFGREFLIPGMFIKLLTLKSRATARFTTFVSYLERHIELDGEVHTPLAFHMVSHLCGGDRARWREATVAAVTALKSRIELWDEVNERLTAAGRDRAPVAAAETVTQDK